MFSTLTGILLLVAGGLLTHMARQNPPLRAPAWFGPTFAGIGLVGGILMPVSGFWLLLALGLYTTGLDKTSGFSSGP